jgi:competence CoiA-like predicted nuclease
LIKLSKDKEVSPDFAQKLMVSILQQEYEITTTQVVAGMQVGWIMGAASVLSSSASTKTKMAFTYSDHINRRKSQEVVCFNANTSEYLKLSKK